jgi:hypothetical protein
MGLSAQERRAEAPRNSAMSPQACGKEDRESRVCGTDAALGRTVDMYMDNHKHDDDESRFTASLAGLAIALLLTVVGLFLVQKLEAASKLEDCLLQGRTNCAPIEIPVN